MRAASRQRSELSPGLALRSRPPAAPPPPPAPLLVEPTLVAVELVVIALEDVPPLVALAPFPELLAAIASPAPAPDVLSSVTESEPFAHAPPTVASVQTRNASPAARRTKPIGRRAGDPVNGAARSGP